MRFLLVDGSYYVFYRYHAIRQWWGNAHRDQEIGSPHENPLFVETFRRTFVRKFDEIKKKLDLGQHVSMVAMDCPRDDIWRTKLYPEYKATREPCPSIGPFFEMAYNELFQETSNQVVVSHPSLEADDCIAITAKHILGTYDDAEVFIITSDADYFQLASDRIKLRNLQFKDLRDGKSFHRDAETSLFCKIVMGDKSDNITPIFKGCGLKTALKLRDDPSLLEQKLLDQEVKERFERNTRLVDFNRIPEDLEAEFRLQVLNLGN